LRTSADWWLRDTAGSKIQAGTAPAALSCSKLRIDVTPNAARSSAMVAAQVSPKPRSRHTSHIVSPYRPSASS
jgi:hypothetical protein